MVKYLDVPLHVFELYTGMNKLYCVDAKYAFFLIRQWMKNLLYEKTKLDGDK